MQFQSLEENRDFTIEQLFQVLGLFSLQDEKCVHVMKLLYNDFTDYFIIFGIVLYTFSSLLVKSLYYL